MSKGLRLLFGGWTPRQFALVSVQRLQLLLGPRSLSVCLPRFRMRRIYRQEKFCGPQNPPVVIPGVTPPGGVTDFNGVNGGGPGNAGTATIYTASVYNDFANYCASGNPYCGLGFPYAPFPSGGDDDDDDDDDDDVASAFASSRSVAMGGENPFAETEAVTRCEGAGCEAQAGSEADALSDYGEARSRADSLSREGFGLVDTEVFQSGEGVAEAFALANGRGSGPRVYRG